MTKEVTIRISGLHFNGDDDDPSPIEVFTAATYYKKGELHYVLYDEVSEDGSDKTRNMIKWKPHYMEIIKHGTSSIHLTFEDGKKNHTCYQTPYGNFLIAIVANQVRVAELEDKLHIYVDYMLEVDSNHLADCNIQIQIIPKEQTSFLE